MRGVFTVGVRLPGLNEYTKANRNTKRSRSGRPWNEGAEMKATAEEEIAWYIRAARCPRFKVPVRLVFLWHEPMGSNNKWRDPDNICFAKKFVLDAMVAMGVIPDDGHEWVAGFEDRFDWLPRGQAWSCDVTIEEAGAVEDKQGKEGEGETR